MAQRPQKPARTGSTAATVGYEAQLWQMADALRGSMDAAEYKHVVLGLIFLKYISDAFEEVHAWLLAEQASGTDPEDPDEYRAQNNHDEGLVAPLHGAAREPERVLAHGLVRLLDRGVGPEAARRARASNATDERVRYKFRQWIPQADV